MEEVQECQRERRRERESLNRGVNRQILFPKSRSIDKLCDSSEWIRVFSVFLMADIGDDRLSKLRGRLKG